MQGAGCGGRGCTGATAKGRPMARETSFRNMFENRTDTVPASRFKLQGSGFGVWGLGFGVRGKEFVV